MSKIFQAMARVTAEAEGAYLLKAPSGNKDEEEQSHRAPFRVVENRQGGNSTSLAHTVTTLVEDPVAGEEDYAMVVERILSGLSSPLVPRARSAAAAKVTTPVERPSEPALDNPLEPEAHPAHSVEPGAEAAPAEIETGVAPAEHAAIQSDEPAIPPAAEAGPQEPEQPPVPEPESLSIPEPGSEAMVDPGGLQLITANRICRLLTTLPQEMADPRVTESYRVVRTRLLHAVSKPKVITITSPTSGDGKTLTAINLSAVLALKPDLNIVLVDADLRRGDIHVRCGLPQGPGLGDFLFGACSIDQIVVRSEQMPNLSVITCGSFRENPVELLDSARWRALIDELRARFRFVLIDAPPMGVLADYALLESVSDGVLLVVRQDYTGRAACESALRMAPKEKRLGVIMNGVTESIIDRKLGAHLYRGGYMYSPESM